MKAFTVHRIRSRLPKGNVKKVSEQHIIKLGISQITTMREVKGQGIMGFKSKHNLVTITDLGKGIKSPPKN